MSTFKNNMTKKMTTSLSMKLNPLLGQKTCAISMSFIPCSRLKMEKQTMNKIYDYLSHPSSASALFFPLLRLLLCMKVRR